RRVTQILAWPHPAQRREHSSGRKSLAEKEGRRRLGVPALAKGIWRARRDPDRTRDLAAGGRAVWQAQRNVHHRSWHVRPDNDGVCQRRAEAVIFAAARTRRT